MGHEKIRVLLGVIVLVGAMIFAGNVYAYPTQYRYDSDDRLSGSYSCLIKGRPSAFGVARRIAYGEAITHDFGVLLDSEQFGHYAEPIHVAYALFLISERIGDDRALQQKLWLEQYMQQDMIDRVRSVIYRKFSKNYLTSCFSIEEKVGPQHVSKDFYPIYMD
tara:strand:+ start:484 stop:972 length:489 start_codon:yes stop_codon:yes gene_type:complete